MALDDDATLVPAVGHYFRAPQFTARPADPLAPGSPWVDLGHTKLDGPFAIGSEGGDATTLGTWQNKSLRVSYAPRVESVAIELKQWDVDSLKLYYGSNAPVVAGNVRVPANGLPTLAALFCLISDGVDKMAAYWPSVSMFRGDDIEFDAEDLAGLPVLATILGQSGEDWLYEITPKGAIGASAIDVTPSTSSKAAGQTTQLAVVATYPDASTEVVTTQATYLSSDPTKATVNAAGLITFVAIGSATITATFQGKTDTCAVTVTA